MDEGGLAFDLIRRVVRAVPDRLSGKTRLARLALRPFLKDGMVRIPDRFGNVLHLPGLEEPISVGLFAFGVYEPDTLWAILRHLRPSGVFVDVGANVGALASPQRLIGRMRESSASRLTPRLYCCCDATWPRTGDRISQLSTASQGRSKTRKSRSITRPQQNSVWDPSALNSAPCP